MIDQWNCHRVERLGESFDEGYIPDQAVQGAFIRNQKAPVLTLVFPPWHGGGPAIKILTNRLAKAGSAVLSFNFHDSILEPSAYGVIESFNHMEAGVQGATTKLLAENNYQKIRLVGLSLGTVSLALAARILPNFDSATVVVGSSNLALSMWEGKRTAGVRRGLQAQGVTAREIDQAWQMLAPKNHAECFEGKDVNMVISRSDNIVPTHYQNEFAEHLTKAGANLSVSYTRLGHYAAAGQFCLTGK
jgi:hypothetical protein